MSELTEEQKQALYLDRNISVTAGAGAGKTRLLVERFLKIAIEHYRNRPHKVRSILAITFTNKAAGEMKERIAESINERIEQTTDVPLRNHLLAIRDQLNSVAISTIHAFCTRILREYPIEAELAPDFTELDDMQSALLMNEAIEETLQQLNVIQNENALKQIWGMFEFWERKTVVQLLRTALRHPFEMESIVQRYANFTEETFLNFLNDLWLNEMRATLSDDQLRYLLHLIKEILAVLPAPVSDDLTNITESLQACQSLPVIVNQLSVYDFQHLLNLSDLFTGGGNKPYASLNNLGKKKNWPVQIHKTLLELSKALSDWHLQEKPFFPGSTSPGINDLNAFRHFMAFLQLYRQAAQRYEAKKMETPAVDFEDLLLKTYHLIKTNHTVRHELSERYKFIMVDEFQDTNALQWKIIEQLALHKGQLAADKIFIVGDPKQSIYGFRNADIRIFRQVKQTFAQAAGFDSPEAFTGNVLLKNSFRFLPDLNAFINDLFAHILQQGKRNAYEVGFQPLIAKRDVPSGNAHIELALLSQENDSTEEEYIAVTIDRLVNKDKATCFEWEEKEVERPLQFGDIAVLLRSRNNLLAIEQALRNKGIPFKTVKGIGYWQQQEIYDFYHLLRFLSDPTEDFALIGILRSKLLMVPDDVLYFLSEEDGENYWQKLNGNLDRGQYAKYDLQRLKTIRRILNRWIQLRNFLPLNELLETVLDNLHYRALLTSQINGEQLLANIEKFIEHVFRFNNSGILGLIDLIRQVELFIEQSLREGEPQINLEDKSTVKLMTIHAAKGLQFPVVFIPYLNTDNLKKGGGNIPAIYLDAEMGLGANPRDDILQTDQANNKKGKNQYTLLNLLKLQQVKKDLAEAKRIFYVGVTRASNHLFLSAKIKKDYTGKEIIRHHSALEWIIDHYNRQSFKILDSESTEYAHPEYKLNIVRSVKSDEQETQEISSWLNGLKQLEDRTAQPQPVEEKNLYLYRPLTDRPGAITFSATRLMTYQQNHREYYKRYHLGFFESDYELFADAIYRSDDSLIKGKILHRFLQLLTEGSFDEQETMDRVLFEYEVFDPQKQEQFREEILHLKEKITHSPIGRKIIQARPARNEIPMTMRLGDDYFTGTIDRIIRDEANLWHVVDYKTNRIHKNKLQAAGKKYQQQMKGYALLLSRLLPEQEIFPVDLYFIHPDALYSKIYSKEDIQNIEQEFLHLIAEIKEKFPVGGKD